LTDIEALRSSQFIVSEFRVVESIVPVVITSPSIVVPPESKLTIPFIDLIYEPLPDII
jgi:hypothetical protein